MTFCQANKPRTLACVCTHIITLYTRLCARYLHVRNIYYFDRIRVKCFTKSFFAPEVVVYYNGNGFFIFRPYIYVYIYYSLRVLDVRIIIHLSPGIRNPGRFCRAIPVLRSVS